MNKLALILGALMVQASFAGVAAEVSPQAPEIRQAAAEEPQPHDKLPIEQVSAPVEEQAEAEHAEAH